MFSCSSCIATSIPSAQIQHWFRWQGNYWSQKLLLVKHENSIAQPKTDKLLTSPSHFSSFFTVELLFKCRLVPLVCASSQHAVRARTVVKVQSKMNGDLFERQFLNSKLLLFGFSCTCWTKPDLRGLVSVCKVCNKSFWPENKIGVLWKSEIRMTASVLKWDPNV